VALDHSARPVRTAAEHGIYRGAALLQFAIEQRLPRRLRIGGE
jgi:hypothetical protein